MKIHTVQHGDTLYSIAQKYNTPISRLETDNDTSRNSNLSIGQALLISEPTQIYIVQEGDTLPKISDMFGVPIKQLLRYNPSISLRENFSIFPSEELVINYHTYDKAIQINGFTTTYISNDVLLETFPFLTYVSILGYRILASGELSGIEDTNIINKAHLYNVAPLLFITSMDSQGKGSYGTTHLILTNNDIQNTFINNVFYIMKTKGYYGMNIGFYHVLEDDLPLYVECIKKLAQRAKNEGYIVFVSLIPETFRFDPNTPYPYQYIQEIGLVTDYVILSTFLWPKSTMEQNAKTTPYYLKQYLDYVITQIPSEKIFLGLSRIAYDWEIPYVENETSVSTFTNAAAVSLANQLLVPIQFEETTQTSYFNYNDAGIDHFVWFKDARTGVALLNLIYEYNLVGLSAWNILFYYPQLWVTIASQYSIMDFETNTSSDNPTM
jgi:spore germination protein